MGGTGPTTTTDAATHEEDASSAIPSALSDTAIDPPLQHQDADAAVPPPAPPDPLAPSSVPDATVESAVYDAPVPTETHFASREELLSYVHNFTVQHGYAVVIQKSNVPRGQVWLRCDLGGSYKSTHSVLDSENANARKRKCSSRLKNCPFQLYARRLPDARWLLRVQNASHNHDVAADTEQLVAHPIARRMTLEQKKFVDELTEMGARPALIVEKMKEKFPDKPIKVQDIYNARNYIRRERSAGRVPFREIAEEPEGADRREQQVAASVDPTQPRQQNVNQADSGEEPAISVAATPPALPASQRRPSNSTPSLQQVAAAPRSERASAPQLSLAATNNNTAESASVGGAQDSRNTSKQKDATSAAVANEENLQTLLGVVNENFSTWQPRAQKQFLFQLDVLLQKTKKGTGRVSTMSSSLAASQTRRRQLQHQNHQLTAPITDPLSNDATNAPPQEAFVNRISGDTAPLL